MDASLAFALLVLSLPVMAAVMLLVKLTSPGPTLYSQTRVGRNGRTFTMYKIRTMVRDSERETGAVWSTEGDPRVTPLGRFLRRTHLDEMPQLWNIVRGEMSLVGPRPERPEFVSQLEAVLPHYPRRLLVRPGLTGLAQVRLPPDTDVACVRRKLAFDLFYIERRGLWLDLRLCLCTAALLAGVPFHASCRLLRVPTAEAVARSYPGLLYTPGAGPRGGRP
jgi:lipopolysaccharide/colanic/teichoic acid biosynthesis glycosyltransferase